MRKLVSRRCLYKERGIPRRPLTRLGVHVPEAHFFPRDRLRHRPDVVHEEGLNISPLLLVGVGLSARMPASGLGPRVEWTEDELVPVVGRRSGDCSWFCCDQSKVRVAEKRIQKKRLAHAPD